MLRISLSVLHALRLYSFPFVRCKESAHRYLARLTRYIDGLGLTSNDPSQKQESLIPTVLYHEKTSANSMASAVGSVGWQVDLPGLASLVLNLGTAGLKRFAEAGVDFHTILCMGEIAEQCPASNEYRRELSECRQKQRKQSQWLYKVVEIGAGTNFVADELLKRRAGENVVALMSALVPVMSESSCDDLLLKLFEACATPLDKTPGYGQLRCIRETLLPLARKTQFKDKVFQYHLLVQHLLGKSDPAFEMSAYQSIPDEDTAVHLILALAKLTQQEKNVILEFDSLNGAGWVIAYARHVLGLPTCILSSASTSVPISEDYRNARVILRLYAKEAKCRLLVEGDLQEFFETSYSTPSDRDGWVIDTTRVNVLDSYISQSDPLRKGISPIARSLVHECTRMISESVGDPKSHIRTDQTAVRGLTNYGAYCLPAIRRKAHRILGYFGFDPVEADSTYVGFGPLSRYLVPFVGSDYEFQRGLLEDEEMEPTMAPGPMWIQSNLGHIKADILDKTAVERILYTSGMVIAACTLAFTDWDQHLRLISVSFLESPRFLSLLKMGGGLSWTSLCGSIIDITVGGHHDIFDLNESDRRAAFQHRGVVFAKTALYQDLNLDACYIRLVPGNIAVNGERKYEMYTPYDECGSISETCAITDARPQTSAYVAADHFPESPAISRVKLSAERVVLFHSVVTDNHIHTLPGPGDIRRTLGDLLVTMPCSHSYYDKLNLDTLTLHGVFKGAIIHQGILFSDYPRSTQPEIWLQSVDQNPVAQWLATQAFGYRPRILTIIQRDCCMACVFKRIDEGFIELIPGDYKLRMVRIVNGRLAGEDMK